MKGEFTCILCPTSCLVTAEWNETELLSIDHSRCRLAWDYIQAEVFDPKRTLTSTVLVEGGDLPLVDVKTDDPVPEGLIKAMMECLGRVVVKAPIDIGDVIVRDLLGTGANIVATKKVQRRGQ